PAKVVNRANRARARERTGPENLNPRTPLTGACSPGNAVADTAIMALGRTIPLSEFFTHGQACRLSPPVQNRQQYERKVRIFSSTILACKLSVNNKAAA